MENQTSSPGLVSRLKNKIKFRLNSGEFLFKIFSPFLPVMVRIFKYVAYSGKGADLCLEHGFLPMQVHYYSPVPDISDLRDRQVWQRRSELPGVDFREEFQVKFLSELGEKYGSECNWSPVSTGAQYEYYTENNSFSFGCAAGLHTMLRYYKPRKVFEIGSGFSSLVFSGALTRNAAEGHSCDYTIVDPYPSRLLDGGKLPELKKIIAERVELTDVHMYESLGENDILFIDSGHTVRTGGDVNFLFLDVLPRLSPGVLVHIHDIDLPYEYPEVYFTNPSFRMFWTESYLLQSFLALNSDFEVLLGMKYLMLDKKNEFAAAFPGYDPSRHKAVSGSFWIRRKS
jgi:hypothetical protein